jgi:hypothetical protein
MALQAKLLSVGVDTLKVNVKLKEQVQVLPINVEILCSYWQQQAREQSKQVATTMTFHNARMTMLPNGAPAWKYLVKNDCLQVSMGARLRMPMVAKVTLSSAYLWQMGKDRAFYRGRKLETITFSGHGSPVNCKLYNKTAEIKQRPLAWFYDR